MLSSSSSRTRCGAARSARATASAYVCLHRASDSDVSASPHASSCCRNCAMAARWRSERAVAKLDWCRAWLCRLWALTCWMTASCSNLAWQRGASCRAVHSFGAAGTVRGLGDACVLGEGRPSSAVPPGPRSDCGQLVKGAPADDSGDETRCGPLRRNSCGTVSRAGRCAVLCEDSPDRALRRVTSLRWRILRSSIRFAAISASKSSSELLGLCGRGFRSASLATAKKPGCGVFSRWRREGWRGLGVFGSALPARLVETAGWTSRAVGGPRPLAGYGAPKAASELERRRLGGRGAAVSASGTGLLAGLRGPNSSSDEQRCMRSSRGSPCAACSKAASKFLLGLCPLALGASRPRWEQLLWGARVTCGTACPRLLLGLRCPALTLGVCWGPGWACCFATCTANDPKLLLGFCGQATRAIGGGSVFLKFCRVPHSRCRRGL
mmetsp:Transcript_52277/g.147128  ORF Transcript_52277/g.147128 Transcript_52277/m.147128 type:complete len:439 (-) Transcript_52277:136-1452(-)